MNHNWEFETVYTDTSYRSFELLHCTNCKQQKLGKELHDVRGVMGPYNVYNGRNTCPTPEEVQQAKDRQEQSRQQYLAEQERERTELERKSDAVLTRSVLAGVSLNELPFTLEEARALYEAGYESGLERGADGGSFEGALRQLGRYV